MGMVLRELDGARANFRTLLATHAPQTILVTDQQGRCIEVDLFPDGVDAWLLKIRSGERVLFDCGGHGIGGLDDEGLAKIVVAAFLSLDKTPQAN